MQAVKTFRIQQLARAKRFQYLIPPVASALDAPIDTATNIPNPFLPHKNPSTGRWAPPALSLRQQAVLVKQARRAGVSALSLLPPGPKLHPAELGQARVWAQEKAKTRAAKSSKEGESVQVRAKTRGWKKEVAWAGVLPRKLASTPASMVGEAATGVGVVGMYAGRKRMFKGHKWERVRAAREAKKRVLMRDMEKRIRKFKTHYARRRPHPLKPARTTKAPKLPF